MIVRSSSLRPSSDFHSAMSAVMFTSWGIQWLAQPSKYFCHAHSYLNGTSWFRSALTIDHHCFHLPELFPFLHQALHYLQFHQDFSTSLSCSFCPRRPDPQPGSACVAAASSSVMTGSSSSACISAALVSSVQACFTAVPVAFLLFLMNRIRPNVTCFFPRHW